MKFSKKLIAAMSCPTCGAYLVRLPESHVWVCPDGLHSKSIPDHILYERVAPLVRDHWPRFRAPYELAELWAMVRALTALHAELPPVLALALSPEGSPVKAKGR